MSAWKEFESAAAKLFNARRFWANSGERFDFEGPHAIGQCKLTKNLSLEALTKLAEEATAEGERAHKLGVVCVKVRRGSGVASPPLVVMTFKMFQDYFDFSQRPS